MFLNDQETDVDLLYYEAIAKTVVKLIRSSPETPVTIGVHGDWGAGKSSVLKMTAAALASDQRTLCLHFNGWTFEGFDDAKTVVMETIVAELRRARPTTAKVKELASKLFKRIDWLKLTKRAGGAALAFTATSAHGHVAGLLAATTALLANPKEHFSFEQVKAVAEHAGEYVKAAKEEPDPLAEHVHAFRKEFSELLEAASIDRLVVIVDDLDRCLPETAIATLEAIRLFLFVPRTAFVMGVDELMIEYAVREHFPDLPPSSGPVSYARNYLEKLIQVPFRIPALGLAETRIYVSLLLAEASLGSGDAHFQKLHAAAREELRRPWQSSGLAELEKPFGTNIPPPIVQALTVSRQISKILSDGTRGNPRQIKRFLNSMMLRQAIAEERGFADEIKRPILAKLMLAERFAPEFYEQVARLAAAAPNGKSPALAHFEERARATDEAEDKPSKDEKPKRARPKADDMSPEAQEWNKSEWAKAWAGIDPLLTDVDLRPYVFVTRDKRTYLGGLAAASHLESLVDRLTGQRLGVQQALPEIRKLAGAEPEQVLEALCTRITQGDQFDTEPPGVQGLIALVGEHAGLQGRLLTFVRSLPEDKVGAWAATSWGASFTGPLAREFESLLEGWSSSQTVKAVLRTAAGAVRKMPPRPS
jgi:predicted KAP-like P-loop ATPase